VVEVVAASAAQHRNQDRLLRHRRTPRLDRRMLASPAPTIAEEVEAEGEDFIPTLVAVCLFSLTDIETLLIWWCCTGM